MCYVFYSYLFIHGGGFCKLQSLLTKTFKSISGISFHSLFQKVVVLQYWLKNQTCVYSGPPYTSTSLLPNMKYRVVQNKRTPDLSSRFVVHERIKMSQNNARNALKISVKRDCKLQNSPPVINRHKRLKVTTSNVSRVLDEMGTRTVKARFAQL